MPDHEKTPPLLALISTAQVEQADSAQHQDYSDLLWTLWRLGAHTMIAQEKEHQHLQYALQNLLPPPLPQTEQHPILDRLHIQQKARLKKELWKYLPWSKTFQLLPVPSEPFAFDHLKLCFHDELIGNPQAFLIHYGLSEYRVSGYHHPISAISVPVGQEVSALLIARLPYQTGSDDSPIIETCVIHLGSQGQKLKGPWWPRIQSQPI